MDHVSALTRAPSPILTQGTSSCESIWLLLPIESDAVKVLKIQNAFSRYSVPEHIKQVLSQPTVFNGEGIVTFNDKYLEKSLVGH